MNERESKLTKLNDSDTLARKDDAQFKSTEDRASAGESKPINALTPEEQLALYEKELKESDWGHQPC